MNLLMFLFYY